MFKKLKEILKNKTEKDIVLDINKKYKMRKVCFFFAFLISISALIFVTSFM